MTDATEQRKLAAIMFTDMVGYSALSQRDDKLALELLEEHRELLREIFSPFNGNEIKTIGDAFLVEFRSALEAAQCAIEIQRTLAKRNADIVPDRRIDVRIGIHIGDVVHRGGDMYGDGVNVASRIEALAKAGGICVSMDVERQIRNLLEARLEKLAPTELKNISVPMDLFRIVLPWEQRTASLARSESKPTSRKLVPTAIALGLLLVIGIGWWWTARKPLSAPRQPVSGTRDQSANIPEKSIAVLPFDSLSEDKNNAFFAEGVQDEILTRLAKVADLKVIARTSTQKFKSAPENLPDIAKQLGAMNILEGSVQKVNDQVRVNVQLINALTNAHLWAEIYDRKLTDIFATESDIAKTIAETLQAKLTGSEKTAIAKKPTANTEAYELYLKGRFFWNKRTGADLRKAIDYFNQAIAKDPNYALAYSGLADSYLLLPAYGAGAPKDSIPQAKAAVKKALELDDTLAEAHASSGRILSGFDFDSQQAISEFERALQLNPNYATAHHWFGSGPVLALGRFDQSIVEAKRSIELDPLSMINNADFGNDYYYARRYDEAIAQLRKTIEIEPRFYLAHYYLAQALQLKGQLPEAIAEYRKATELDDDPFALALLGQAYARSGQTDDAKKILARLNEEAKSRYVAAYGIGVVFLGMGDKNRAMDELERAYRENDGNDIYNIRVDPLLDDLRGNPRFEALAEKIIPAAQFRATSK
ncbi:MAG TPA: adenylate/guanylate cyclase domain-containing protein [Chthoniobacterales bacterium]|jgi:adenylate cyclase|nr:adenylate/guanylate cyclase domain-containing protein [Chthoniobacterales bacterium]